MSEENPHMPAVLLAGQLIFGCGIRRVRTLLGSCVAITLWHPARAIGGICHFAVPGRPPGEPEKLNARYGDDCIELFRQLAETRGTLLREYDARIFGGGNMLASSRILPASEFSLIERNPIGDANAAAAFSMLAAEGVHILEADVGEQGYRKLEFDPATGETSAIFVPVGSDRPRQ